ncbi:MAG TPA: DUF1232 domain-containing protein [Woeseiaceae bacterium]|nr:DUF1232 domain-containing protein [Woeseiaceae bacterium]
MARKLVLELSNGDIDYYRKVMHETWRRKAKQGERAIMDEARRLLKRAQKSEGPGYVRQRLEDLGTLISMLEDSEWPLDREDRGRIVVALSYFAEPQDMIPDNIPGLGFLDDALLAELVIGELEHELAGYREFCEYREREEVARGKDAHVGREDWLDAKRRQIFLQIRRRQRESGRHSPREGVTDPILQYMTYPY